MDFKNIDHWAVEKLNDGFIFCVQRLDELLFDYTIDSYKPRALNAPSLCFELLKVINEVENDSIDKNNIKYILDELRLAIKEDKVAKKLIPSNIDYFLGYDENTSLSELKLRISVLERSLERYRYINLLREYLLDSVEKNNKDEINRHLSCYITTFINWGISKQFLYQKMNQFFFDSNVRIDSSDKFKEFLDAISPKAHNYKVYFRVSKNIRLLQESFKFFNLNLINEPQDELKAHFERHSFMVYPKYVIIEVRNIHVPDPFVARDIAENRLQTLRNTSQLFFHKSKLVWTNSAIVVQFCCENESIVAKNQINPMKKSLNYKSSDVAKNTNKIFQNLALQGESLKKFIRVMELHSNCLTNVTPENQIVNLWTILETLIPSSKNKSKVQTVCDSIIPILLLKYFKKLISSLYNDFIRWDKDTISDFIAGIGNADSALIEKFSLFLSCEEYEDLRTKLYEKLNNYIILRNRAFKLSEIISRNEDTINHLDRHQMNVSWQIRRVYRTRNMIVHSGKSPKYINILVENTHDYIDQVTSAIVDMATSNYRINYLEQAFEFGKILNTELRAKIKKNPKPINYIPALIYENRI